MHHGDLSGFWFSCEERRDATTRRSNQITRRLPVSTHPSSSLTLARKAALGVFFRQGPAPSLPVVAESCCSLP